LTVKICHYHHFLFSNWQMDYSIVRINEQQMCLKLSVKKK